MCGLESKLLEDELCRVGIHSWGGLGGRLGCGRRGSNGLLGRPLTSLWADCPPSAWTSSHAMKRVAVECPGL